MIHSHKPYLVLFRVEIVDPKRHWWEFHHKRLVEEATIPPNGEIKMNPVTVSIGHTVNCSISYLDAIGNTMLITPTPDAPPVWTDTTPATGTLTTVPGGLAASELAVAAGSDTVSVSLAVGGVTYAASAPIIVSPAPQVLTSIAIVTSVT
jgi:hypothetical protein